MFLGYLAWVVSKITIAYGHGSTETSVFYFPTIIALIWIIFWVILSIFHHYFGWLRNKTFPKKEKFLTLTKDRKYLMDFLKLNLATETIMKRIPKLKFVFFNEGVYDMTGYL